jgi:hypothetical protein
LKALIKTLVLWKEANENVSSTYPIAFLEMDPKPLPVKLPTQRVYSKIDVLAVNESKVVRS